MKNAFSFLNKSKKIKEQANFRDKICTKLSLDRILPEKLPLNLNENEKIANFS